MIKEIDRSDWDRFFTSFTLAHEHWLVSVDGENESIPLEALIARDTRVTITLGRDISHHRRIVIDALRVSAQQTGGEDEAVAIESMDGHVTRLRFRSPGPVAPAAD